MSQRFPACFEPRLQPVHVQSHLAFTCRRVTSDSQHLPANWRELVRDMNLRIAFTVMAFNIPPSLLISFDESPINFSPASGTTLAVEGSKEVKAAGSEDKRACTVVLACTAAGDLLPFQIIFNGESEQSTPGYKPKSAAALKNWQPLPARAAADAGGHDTTATKTHWCTVESLKRYITKVAYPYYVQLCLGDAPAAGGEAWSPRGGQRPTRHHSDGRVHGAHLQRLSRLAAAAVPLLPPPLCARWHHARLPDSGHVCQPAVQALCEAALPGAGEP